MSMFKKKYTLNIEDQIKAAFTLKSNQASIIHGVRRIILGSACKRTALFSSRKNKAMIPVESRLELAYALELEREPRVKLYRTQALKIALLKDKYIYPDFLVKYADEKIEVHEVVPNKLFMTKEEIFNYSHLEKILDSYQLFFRIIDQNDIPTEIEFLKLCYFYTRCRDQIWSSDQIQKATKIIPYCHNLLLGEIYDILEKNNLKKEIGDYLIFNKYIDLPISIEKRRLCEIRGALI